MDPQGGSPPLKHNIRAYSDPVTSSGKSKSEMTKDHANWDILYPTNHFDLTEFVMGNGGGCFDLSMN
jgi:hypothetical protein